MKTRGDIISVESTGDGVRVKAQCKFRRAPDWEPYHVVTLSVPSRLASAYYVGRVIQIEVKAT